jgi:hypothetical protein
VLRGVTVGAEGSVSMDAVVVRAPVGVLWDALHAVLSDGRAVELPEVRLSDRSTPEHHTQPHRALVQENALNRCQMIEARLALERRVEYGQPRLARHTCHPASHCVATVPRRERRR